MRYGLNSYTFLSSSFITRLILITGSTSLECFGLRSDDLMAVCVKLIVLWNVMPYRLIVYQRLRQTYIASVLLMNAVEFVDVTEISFQIFVVIT